MFKPSNQNQAKTYDCSATKIGLVPPNPTGVDTGYGPVFLIILLMVEFFLIRVNVLFAHSKEPWIELVPFILSQMQQVFVDDLRIFPLPLMNTRVPVAGAVIASIGHRNYVANRPCAPA